MMEFGMGREQEQPADFPVFPLQHGLCASAQSAAGLGRSRMANSFIANDFHP
jgi:hypothetical protein